MGGIELKYTGGLDGTQVCGRVLYSSSIREGLIELKYTGGFESSSIQEEGIEG